MINFFNKLPTPFKRFTVKRGIIKELSEHKNKLVNEVKKLESDKTELSNIVDNMNNEISQKDELYKTVQELKENKFTVEKNLALLYKAQEFTLNIKDLEKKQRDLNINIKELEDKKQNIEQSLNNLKEEKAVLLDDISNLNMHKTSISSNDMFSIEYVDSLNDGLDFEKFFAKLLDRLGFYDIKVTSGSGDFGIDVLAYNDDILYGFQCKLYSNTVGNNAVQEAYSGKEHYSCNVAVVVTNNYFTNQAISQAKETKVLLWDRNVLINKLKEASKFDFTINK